MGCVLAIRKLKPNVEAFQCNLEYAIHPKRNWSNKMPAFCFSYFSYFFTGWWESKLIVSLGRRQQKDDEWAGANLFCPTVCLLLLLSLDILSSENLVRIVGGYLVTREFSKNCYCTFCHKKTYHELSLDFLLQENLPRIDQLGSFGNSTSLL